MPLAAEDHLAILDLIARQSHAIDLGNPEMWADCFTEGGEFDASLDPPVSSYAENVTFDTSGFEVGSGIALGCNSVGGVQTCPP
jgi:hypothetical protein